MTYQEEVTRYLIEKNLSITFMESCTSGLLASMFTDTEGASAVFKGSLVTYSNEMKVAAGVNPQILETHGVYSAECAEEMAKVAKKTYSSDIAVGITGTTGNEDPKNSGSLEGEAFYCIITGDKANSFNIRMDVAGLSRKSIKEAYAQKVYESLKMLFHIG